MLEINEYWSKKWAASFKIYTAAVTVSRDIILASH